jgi:sugar lactone lactonase YvrE
VTYRFDVDLVEFTPSHLEAGGTPFPNTTITSVDFSSPEGIQFDGAGTLWIADIFSGEIFGFKAQTLAAAEGTVVDLVPDIVNSSQSIFTPTDVVIDKSGNQWVVDLLLNSILEFSAADIAASGSPTPVVALTATNVTTAGGTALSLDFPQGLTFDHGGNLWVSNALSDNSGSIAKFSKDQIAASGNPNPEVFLDSDPDGLNLDTPVILSFGPNIK